MITCELDCPDWNCDGQFATYRAMKKIWPDFPYKKNGKLKEGMVPITVVKLRKGPSTNYVTYNGEEYNLYELATKLGIKGTTLYAHIKKGGSVKTALRSMKKSSFSKGSTPCV